jgi:hypothetical protein
VYLLSDLFTYYEHDPDLHHDDDETPADAGSPGADSPGADAPTDDPPPDLAHVAVVTT